MSWNEKQKVNNKLWFYFPAFVSSHIVKDDLIKTFIQSMTQIEYKERNWRWTLFPARSSDSTKSQLSPFLFPEKDWCALLRKVEREDRFGIEIKIETVNSVLFDWFVLWLLRSHSWRCMWLESSHASDLWDGMGTPRMNWTIEPSLSLWKVMLEVTSVINVIISVTFLLKVVCCSLAFGERLCKQNS